jgi:hypothetical protein
VSETTYRRLIFVVAALALSLTILVAVNLIGGAS